MFIASGVRIPLGAELHEEHERQFLLFKASFTPSSATAVTCRPLTSTFTPY